MSPLSATTQSTRDPLIETFSAPPTFTGEVSTLTPLTVPTVAGFTNPISTLSATVTPRPSPTTGPPPTDHNHGLDTKNVTAMAIGVFDFCLVLGLCFILYKTEPVWRQWIRNIYPRDSQSSNDKHHITEIQGIPENLDRDEIEVKNENDVQNVQHTDVTDDIEIEQQDEVVHDHVHHPSQGSMTDVTELQEPVSNTPPLSPSPLPLSECPIPPASYSFLQEVPEEQATTVRLGGRFSFASSSNATSIRTQPPLYQEDVPEDEVRIEGGPLGGTSGIE
ncbi:hypothetical protein QCA50_007181 [Cerrena zonata]|uniref:Transmembrane protein n=1 Tax=Cerrena zonata TaxID=2478898 RepID=A0AAW0GDG8_9APHY